jgi:[NiFe] hydrogenase diaphorase moiety large subunit
MGSANSIQNIVKQYEGDRTRLLDIVRDVQADKGHISDETLVEIAKALGIHRVEVEDMVSFYHFLPREPQGAVTVRLCKAVIEKQHGMPAVAKAFEKAVGVPFGQTSADGKITLQYTSCIGMSDQAPAALVDGHVVTSLRPEDVPDLVATLKKDGKLSGSRVETNLQMAGPCIFSPSERGAAIRASVNGGPEDVIAAMNASKLRGRGGAGFPLAMKWDFCRKAKGEAHYVVCNADEGEPGTFKDRVIFTEVPDLVFEGMTVAGYAIGASQGLLYLRAEYAYLLDSLEEVLSRRRRLGLLGKDVVGKEGFDFDIRIQLGAGAYICGEESSLLESAEGKRGAPRDRPPFPVTNGYMNQPTALNNAETLCCAARIMEKGAEWFTGMGTRDSTGTKLFSVSGDVRKPGVYELDWGLSVNQLLEIVGAENVQAVQVGGASGTCIAPKDFGRRICFEDIPTGGSIMVFGESRDMLDVVSEFADFFVEESCGWCAPCRVGTSLIRRMLQKIIDGRGTMADLDQLEALGNTVKTCSRCGLGQTAANPFLTTLQNMPEIYRNKIQEAEFIPLINIKQAVAMAEGITGRKSHVKEAD